MAVATRSFAFTVTTASVEHIQAFEDRVELLIMNNGSATVFWSNLNVPALTIASGFPLKPGRTLKATGGRAKQAWYFICAAGTVDLRATES
jgi:hypothetical protein